MKRLQPILSWFSAIKKNIFASTRNKVLAAVALVAIAATGYGLYYVSPAQDYVASRSRRTSEAKAQQLESERVKILAEQARVARDEEAKKTAEAAKDQPPAVGDSSNGQGAAKKYSTSSDPRSTAYSTTPPPPNPASFDIAITRSNQVAPGTLISYNATKNEKTYYGGDLQLSRSNVTISKSNPAASLKDVTVSAPDGAVVGMPALPWNDRLSNFGIAMDSSQYKSSGTTFNMFVDMYGNAPVGTYRMHITTYRTAQTADGWQYDAFITITVVD